MLKERVQLLTLPHEVTEILCPQLHGCCAVMQSINSSKGGLAFSQSIILSTYPTGFT